MSVYDETPVWRGRRVPDSPVVSVCVPVVSDHGLIEGCLDSLADSGSSVDTEVVVVANGLTGDGLSSLQKREDIILAHSKVNAGFSGGNNLAARFARGRYLLLINDDSVVEPGYIDRLLKALERDPSIAAAGGAITGDDGTLQEAGSVLWSDGWVAHVGAGLPADSTAYAYARRSDYISANGLLVTRRAWDVVGGLDERYFPAYYEDVDLCLALWERGYQVVYEPRARLKHLESQSTSTTFRNFLLIRNRGQLVAKWSDLLQTFADHPDPIDAAAIDAAVLRAQRSLGRVLVLEGSANASAWHGLASVEQLARAGWSVMVSVPADRQLAGKADAAVRDRLVDWGVDVRAERPETLLTLYADDFEAVVVTDGNKGVGLSLGRPDGSSIPLVEQGEKDDDSIVTRVTGVARSRGTSSSPVKVDPAAGARQVVTIGDAEPRELAYAEAGARIRDEYREFLELELARTQADLDETNAAFRRLVTSFDEKERYIDSLLSVRVKKWIVCRRRGRET